MIDARAVALNGIGFSPAAVASLGFIAPTPLPPVAGVSGGGYWSFREDRKWGDDFYNLSLLHKQDQEVTELLVSLVTQGFFHE